MIRKPTVLILGAGASQQYGFPLGRELHGKVASLWSPGEDPPGALLDMEFNRKKLDEFLDELKGADYGSVDEFLEHNPEFVEVDKAIISYVMIKYASDQNQDKLSGIEHWYRYLLDCLEVTSDRMTENNITILTFNYDRSLEHYLIRTIKHRRKTCDEAKCKRLLEQCVPIIHLHGSLGAYPGDGQIVRRNENVCTANTLRMAAHGIRIIHESDSQFPDFENTRHRLEKAERIYFLGFGYHPTNIRRLQIFNKSWTKERRKSQVVMGTSHGIGAKILQNILDVRLNGNVIIEGRFNNILEFLQENAELS